MLLDIDPDSAVAGWIPLILILFILLCLVGLYYGIRRNLRVTNASVPLREDYLAEQRAARGEVEPTSLEEQAETRVESPAQGAAEPEQAPRA